VTTLKRTYRLALLLAMIGLLASCGSSPAVKYYTLSPQATAGTNKDIALKVGPAEFPRALARSQIVTRLSSTQLDVDEYNVWSAPLEKQFLRVLGDNLGTELGTHRIAVYPSEASFPLDYQLLLDVLQFDGAKGGSVTLRVRWVISTPAGKAIDSGLFEQSQRTAGDNYDALVAAHSKLVADLASAIAKRLQALS
jgi:uncharacterized lipoprotein YmbA